MTMNPSNRSTLAILLAILVLLVATAVPMAVEIATSPEQFLGPYTYHLFLLLTVGILLCGAWTIVLGGRELQRRGKLLKGVLFAAYLVVTVIAGLDAVLEAYPPLIPQRVLANLPFGGNYFFPKGTATYEFRPDLGMKARPNARVEVFYVNDLIRYGQISPVYDYPTTHVLYVTDSQGFRNSDEATTADVVVLGDSFIELPYMPIEAVWPSLVARRTGWRIRNLGASGYSTTHEAVVLRKWGLAYRPRVVVLAFYEGNDIAECEDFELFQKSGLSYSQWVAHRSKSPLAWFERRPVVAMLRMGLLPYQRVCEQWSGQDAETRAARRSYFNPIAFEAGGRAETIGLFSYSLKFLSDDRETMRSQRGWALCREALREMKGLCREIGATLAVLYIPTKERVYLPLLRGRFTAEAVHKSVAAYHSEVKTMKPEAFEAALFANMDETERAVGEFCRNEGIPYFDLTPSFRQAARQGEMIYFPYDSHWNGLGNEIAADQAGVFLWTLMQEKKSP